jgi:hypothetical protein
VAREGSPSERKRLGAGTDFEQVSRTAPIAVVPFEHFTDYYELIREVWIHNEAFATSRRPTMIALCVTWCNALVCRRATARRDCIVVSASMFRRFRAGYNRRTRM